MPPNAASLTSEHQALSGLPVLSLRFDVVERGPDWPVVSILVDGSDPFADIARGWHGFDPDQMLGLTSPLLPVDVARRVALYRCSCGEAGDGVIAPLVVASPDGRTVSWIDFRSISAVFDGPLAEEPSEYVGQRWAIPELHFDREQYEAEVARASADRSWETTRRLSARLVEAQLRARGLRLPPDLPLEWVAPAWDAEGVVLSFAYASETPAGDTHQQILQLTSRQDDPERAAQDIVDQLVRTAPEHRARRFAHRI